MNTTTRHESEAARGRQTHPTARKGSVDASALLRDLQSGGEDTTDASSAASERAASTGSAKRRSVWREPLLALLDYAELDVLDYPDERARVDAVRRAVCARFDRRPMPALDLRDVTFTLGLISTATGAEASRDGLLSRCLRTLSPSAFAEYERAQGFVRTSPPFRC